MNPDVERAASPEDLSRLIVARLNAGDVEGVVALYEPDAVLALPDGGVANGSEEIRRVFQRLLEERPAFEAGTQNPTLCAGELALTSTRLPDGTVTVEVARQQEDGTWLWSIDQPAFIQ
ncbi:nuclear transport factor 2 family protein [Actinoplanes missouriensis]|uniref:YybH family protein n=1 Tax=Actinoplanes missouriensis TaxID=1866 RepID=UPI0033E0DA99